MSYNCDKNICVMSVFCIDFSGEGARIQKRLNFFSAVALLALRLPRSVFVDTFMRSIISGLYFSVVEKERYFRSSSIYVPVFILTLAT